jgi:hypothetical protein
VLRAGGLSSKNRLSLTCNDDRRVRAVHHNPADWAQQRSGEPAAAVTTNDGQIRRAPLNEVACGVVHQAPRYPLCEAAWSGLSLRSVPWPTEVNSVPIDDDKWDWSGR